MIITILFFLVFSGKLWFDVNNHSVSNPYKKSLIWYLLFYMFPLIYLLETGNMTSAIEWVTAYNIELALSVDNLAVILMLMTSANIVGTDQKTILNYGIFGAVVMRLVLLTLGLGLITKAAFIVFPLFGIMLFSAAYAMFTEKEDPLKSLFAKLFTKLNFHPMETIQNSVSNTKWLAALIPVALIPTILAVEATDLLFAVDSIPAVLAISSNWFVVVTSNLAAVAFLRELFFVFSDLQSKLSYLNYGVAAALGVIGLKLVAHPWLHANHMEISPVISLIAVMLPIILSIIVSVVNPKKEENNHA